MKFKYLYFVSLLAAGTAGAQVPEDALRLTWLGQNGTARNQAIGGAMGSLGGDISATFVNPAGLALYKTGELVLTPGFNFLNNKSTYRDTKTSEQKSAFNFGTTGVVLGFGNGNNPKKSGAFSLAVNRTANFNNTVYYKGANNYSSYSEQYAEELAKSGINIGDFDAANSPLSLGARMAVYTYLIDTAKVNGTTQVVGLPEFLASRNQENLIQSTGGITEIAIGLASNSNDKFYFGGSIGLPIVNYERKTTFTESDPSSDNNNNFGSSTLHETYTTKGIGLNAKVGIIYKPIDFLRLGFAIHTPTIYGLKDTYNGDMTTQTEKYAGLVTVNSSIFNSNQPSQYQYNLSSPWKFLLSGSYVFREVEDVTKQKGFITADVEYVNYQGSSYSSADNNGDDTYYKGINSTIKNIYTQSFNVRVGGELKFNTIMARAGYAYYGNPYADKDLKASKAYFSGGLGYRDKGYFLDLTYVYGINKDVNFPYRLSDKSNTFAQVKSNSGNIVLSAGMKF